MTAEFAVAVPAVVLLLGLALGALATASLAVRLQDAAGIAARAFARGEPPSLIAQHLTVIAPGAGVAREDRPGLVCAVVSGRAPGMLSGVALRAESCALAER